MSLQDKLRKKKSRHSWFSDGLCFECQQCGGCCSGAPGYVWISESDLEAMSERLEMRVEDFKEKYCRMGRGKLCLKERPDGDCILLDIEKRVCMVYDIRPAQCRTWPWWPENLGSKDIWDSRGESCPGINSGRKHSGSFIVEQMEIDRKAGS